MNVIDERIIKFLRKQTILTFCTSVNNEPYCASCYYALEESGSALIFKSQPHTAHIKNGGQNAKTAGTILPDKNRTGLVIGVQFTAKFSVVKDTDTSCSAAYYKKFPFALAMDGDLYRLELETVKYTDTALGFGKKIFWKR